MTRSNDDLIAVELIVNGAHRRIQILPRTPLSDALREKLQLTGTKIGCGTGNCGAWTVLLNGESVYACLVPVAQCNGAEVVTVEGYRQDRVLRVLQQSFLRNGAVQCGFCTPGMLIAACRLLRQNARPDRCAIERAMNGVLCRCTGYVKIIDAVLDAARVLDGSLREEFIDTDGQCSVGLRLPRVDGMAKVQGAECFGADRAPGAALWVRAVRSPYARGAFTIGDLTPLYTRYPGLVRVLTAADVPGTNRFGIYPDLKDQPVFAEGIVRYRGETVLALVGERGAVDAINVEELPIEWAPEQPVIGIAAAQADGALLVHAQCPGNLLTTGSVEKGDIGEAERRADVVVEDEFETSFVEHAYIEPEAGFARCVANDRIELMASTQTPYMDREETASILGIQPSRVRVVPSGCGGGFGGKLDLSVQPLLAVAAWVIKRPVRMVYSRVESMTASTKRHPARMKVRAMAQADGTLLGFGFLGDFNTGAYASWGPTVAGRVPVHAAGPYVVPHVKCTARAYYTNETPAGACRGFGTPQAAFASETIYDQLAYALDIDRWEFRYRNAIRTGGTTVTGQVLKASVGMRSCLEAVKDDWQSFLTDALEFNRQTGPVRRGAGIGCMWYGCGNTALANPSRMRLTLERDGTLTFHNGAAEIGQGSSTALLQICADAVGLTPSAFKMVVGDTDHTEDAGKTSASRQTFISGKATYLAGRALRTKLLSMCDADEGAQLRLDGPRLIARNGKVETIIALESLPGEANIVAEAVGTFDPPVSQLDEKGQGTPYATYAFATQICSVDVDVQLGTVAVRKIVAAHDVGKAINPTLVEGQIHGGIVQGLGMALMEQYVPGKTESLHTYPIPTISDVPDITVKLIEDPEPLGPYGAKGVGEPALVATPAAIMSAIRHATGVVVRKMPALPYRLHRMLHSSSAE